MITIVNLNLTYLFSMPWLVVRIFGGKYSAGCFSRSGPPDSQHQSGLGSYAARTGTFILSTSH
jgi:hypothetical protein